MHFHVPPDSARFISRAILFLIVLGGSAVTIDAQSPPGPSRAGVKVLRDLEYARVDDKRLLLDLYRPENSEERLPVIIGIHGGGWASGSKAGGQGSWLAERGFAVAVINYRLSGEAPFPAQIIDCKAAVRWLRTRAGHYGLDPQRFGATGHSAGGHLASLLATSGDVVEWDVGAERDVSSRIQAAAPLAGPTDLLQMDAHAPPGAQLKHNSRQSPESRLIGGPILENRDKAARANPITYVTDDDPPLLIIHGDQDATVPYHQAQLLFEALQQVRVPVHLHTVTGGGHGLGSREANERVAEFFAQHLQGAAAAPAFASATSSSPGRNDLPATARSPLPRGLTWERIRDREDRNKDGKVTADEFGGPPAIFQQLDRNRDGELTASDFESRGTR